MKNEKFKEILNLEKKLKALTALTTQDEKEYFKQRDLLCANLRAFLRTDFRDLNGKQLLKLCALVSSFRPVQPFNFLTTCSILVDKQ